MENQEEELDTVLTIDVMGGYSGPFLLQQQQIFWKILLHKTEEPEGDV